MRASNLTPLIENHIDSTMKIAKFCLIAILVCIPFEAVFADTIVFTSGRQVESDQVWEGSGRVKYMKYGAVVSISEELVEEIVYVDDEYEVENSGFGFDIWPLGIEIDGAMDIAERNDIPLHRAGLISTHKGFHPAISRKYMHTHSRFNYKTRLLGYPSNITLVFSPESKRLARIEISLNRKRNTKDKNQYRDIVKLLSDKYGKPNRHLKTMGLVKNYRWIVEERGQITLEKLFSTAKLTYIDLEWNRQLLLEKKTKQLEAERVRSNRDSKKF
jgi:hypothetical protein